jgi:DNA-binding transcriptional ArsR family regulator
MDFTDLMEELSQGVRLDIESRSPEVVLAPSYWGSPLLVFGKVTEERDILLYGARPPEDSLVPGEMVPDALLRTLKALSDPTRLRILRYLASEPLTPTQLASRLRLRSSTVVHHLNSLRLATLVQFSSTHDKETRYYTARMETIHERCQMLEQFLSGDDFPGEELPD